MNLNLPQNWMSDHSKIKCIFFQDIPDRYIDVLGHQKLRYIKDPQNRMRLIVWTLVK